MRPHRGGRLGQRMHGPRTSGPLVLLVALSHLTAPIISIVLDKQVRTTDVQAVEGQVAEFPCDVTSAQHDKVHMVFWFRDDAGIPLYSFDVRGVGMSEGRHWSAPGVFGPRAHFRAAPPPAALLLQDVKRHDEGVYRCRVDYRNTQTVSFRYNLTVIVPPGEPVVVDRTGGALNGSRIGPKEEGDDLLLTCTVRGGRPPPTVRWLVNGVLVDVEYEHNTGDVIENRLSWPSIGRQDFGSVFTCQAVNSALIQAKEASFTLDMNLRPLTVEMSKPPLPLVADRRYSVNCTSGGSKPHAVITWYKGKRQLKRTKEETKGDLTVSELSFVPMTEDDGRPLTCRAENPELALFLETTIKIQVVYPPQVSLKLGSTLSAEDIKEGDDVYFECHVHSNPPWRKLSWMHNGVVLSHNVTARVVRSNQSLVLQRVARHSAGKYSCSATNPEGETVSDDLTLRVKFAPICRRLGAAAVGAARGERVLVLCEVDADPPARAFKWKFNNSGETLDVGVDRFSSNGSVSILKYTPVADLDFGTLSCTAINDVGHQLTPCIFQMVAAGRPQPLTNCSLTNMTSGAAEVSCEAGFDGGLPQHFVLEVYSAARRDPIYNISNIDPVFTVPLESGVTLRLEVFAANAKGRSPPVTLTGLRLGDAEKQAAPSGELQVPAGWGAAAGGALALLALLGGARARARRARRARAPPAKPPAKPPASQPKPGRELPVLEPVDDRDPDVIPANYEPPALYARTWGAAASPKDTPEPRLDSSTEGLLSSGLQFAQDDPLNVQAFKEKLLDTRLPESCV